MAGVNLTISETLDGSQIADGLSNGGSGTLLGQVTNGSYAPKISAAANTGRQDWFIRGDNVVDPITDMKLHLQTYGVGTGYSYGGPPARSAAADFTTIKAEGAASSSSKNNIDGLSGGIWLEMNVLEMISATNQFDISSRPTEVKIFGDNGTDGQDLASAFTIKSVAAVLDSDQSNGGDATNGYIPDTPTDGTLGVNGDTDYGDNFHVALRVYLRSAFSNGGVYQVEIVTVYTFTA